jgi:hypothetical protein
LRTAGVRSHFLLDQQLESCFTRSQLDPRRCSSVLHFEPIHQGRTDRSREATIVTSVQATDRECGPRGWAWSHTQAFVAVEYFFKSPSDLHERLVIVISPVLATANTAVAAVDRLKERGANDIRPVSLIGVPKGVERMRGIHPDVPIWLAAIDEGLDSNAYILPGLGDAGDRAYGTKWAGDRFSHLRNVPSQTEPPRGRDCVAIKGDDQRSRAQRFAPESSNNARKWTMSRKTGNSVFLRGNQCPWIATYSSRRIRLRCHERSLSANSGRPTKKLSSLSGQTSRIHKPTALVSFDLPDPLSFRVREHAMVAADRGTNLDRESVRVRPQMA